MPKYLMSICCGLALLLLSGVTTAAESLAKPFAQHRVVLQISDPDPFKQTLVLNVAGNLIKHYGPDAVDVEIVAFGPGLRLLLKDNSNQGRIEQLANDSGVRFSACENTIDHFTKMLDGEPELSSHATRVGAGVVRIIDLTSQGYTLIKP